MRKLERSWAQDGMQWAKNMQILIKEINTHQIDETSLNEDTKAQYIEAYQKILAQGDIKCPPLDKLAD
ncbi:MAG: hypothetical protein QF552_05940 [Litorilituus sp.]|jgi:transposase|nr:hypothetical protein [Litorilituus sp.]